MKIRLQNGLGVLKSAFVMATLSAMFACSDNTPGQDSPDSPDGVSPEEAYTRAFTKKFGVYNVKPENWSKANATAVTINAPYSMPVSVYAEIDGERFIFARVTAPKGKYSVPVNIPSYVTELIIIADGQEYKMKPGTEITVGGPQSRAITKCTYGDISELLPGVTWKYLEGSKPTIQLDAQIFLNEYIASTRSGGVGYFQLEDYKANMKMALENEPNNAPHLSSRFATNSPSAKDKWLSVFPVFWKENRYGESDYLLGYYVYHTDHVNQIEMHDLPDANIKQGFKFKLGDGEFSVIAGADSKRAYDKSDINVKNAVVQAEGITIATEGVNKSLNIGFYIKSGLKEGYKDNDPAKGRDYTHISFQSLPGNSDNWDSNYWDLQLNTLRYAYSGAALSTKNCAQYNLPTVVDNEWKDYIHKYGFEVLGFSSMPTGIDGDYPDYSDVVLLVTKPSGIGSGTDIENSGEGERAFPWYLAAEDLGSTDDWDFNDLIVNVYDITMDLTRQFTNSSKGRYPMPDILARRIVVVPRAAGGVYPLYLMYEGEVSHFPTDDCLASAIETTFESGTFVVGTEIHAWLNEPDHTKMINTQSPKETNFGRAVSFCVPIAKDGASFDPKDGPYDKVKDNSTLRGFWVLVDKTDALRGQLFNDALDTTPLEPQLNSAGKVVRNMAECENSFKRFNGKLGQGAYRVDHVENNPSLKAPQMLMCHYTWKWPLERNDISEAFPWFNDWVTGDRELWHPVDNTSTENVPYIPTLVSDNDNPFFYM